MDQKCEPIPLGYAGRPGESAREDSTLHQTLAFVLKELGRRQEALGEYHSMVELHPDSAQDLKEVFRSLGAKSREGD
jgi:hypothetical protein